MSRDPFAIALDHALRPDHDGQPYHKTVGDRGGATAWGITRITLATYLRRRLEQVHDDDIAGLLREDVVPIYRALFWEGMRCHRLPAPLGVMLFDFACGTTKWAPRRLQRLLGETEDGIIGPVTQQAAGLAYARDPRGLLRSYHATRLAYYRELDDYDRFGRGWDVRAARCLELAMGLVQPGPRDV